MKIKAALFLIILFIFTSSFLNPREVALDVEKKSLNPHLPTVSFTVEHAVTSEDVIKGLMYRRHLPTNHGMILHSHSPRKTKIWMLNTYIDLSIAMLDEQGVIKEMHDLKAHPEMLAKRASQSSYESDAVRDFFHKNGVVSQTPVKYVLEMNKGWFKQNQIKVGDVVNWDPSGTRAWVIRTRELSSLPQQNKPFLYEIAQPGMQSITLAGGFLKKDIAFLDSHYRIISKKTLSTKQNNYAQDSIFYCQRPASYILIAPAGWFFKHGIQANDIIRMKSERVGFEPTVRV